MSAPNQHFSMSSVSGDNIHLARSGSSAEKTGGKISTLTVRSQFQAVSRGHKALRNGLILQALPRKPGSGSEIRIGYTCSKKVGNAVVRNRAKRRLRSVARIIIPEHGLRGWDYVLIGRAKYTVALPFESLKTDLSAALAIVHGNSL